MRRRRASRKAASSTITKISVKNRSTAGPNWAASTNARRKFSPDSSTLSIARAALLEFLQQRNFGRFLEQLRERRILSLLGRVVGVRQFARDVLHALERTASCWKSASP